jgi:hypothetical protein
MNNSLNSILPVQNISPERLLRMLGASGTLVGFRYAVYMINRVLDDEDMLLLITKRLYPETAKQYGVKASSVERGLRTLIAMCWKRSNAPMFEIIAGRPVDFMPTNSEFLDMVSSYLRNLA